MPVAEAIHESLEDVDVVGVEAVASDDMVKPAIRARAYNIC